MTIDCNIAFLILSVLSLTDNKLIYLCFFIWFISDRIFCLISLRALGFKCYIYAWVLLKIVMAERFNITLLAEGLLLDRQMDKT